MADKEYKTVTGFVQFDVETAEVNNQEIRRVTVQAAGSEGPLVTVTVWPEFDNIEINKGDFLAANGTFEAREGKGGKVFLNLSASRLVVLPGADKSEAGVVKKETDGKRPF